MKGTISERDYFEAILREMDRRYEQRFLSSEKALEAALVSNKELTAQAAESNKEAVTKAAQELEHYKVVNNEWRGTINDWRQTLIPRTEYNVKHESIEREVAELQKFRAEFSGSQLAKKEDRGISQWVIGLGIGIVLPVVFYLLANWHK